MALPHLALNSARRNVYERTIVDRRNHENDTREQWSNRAKYFHQSNVTAGKKKSWESDLSYKTSMEAWKNRNEKEVRDIGIKRRRLKLAELLSEERTKYEAEMRGLSSDNYERIVTMREKVDGLKSVREDKRQQLANEKLYEHWRVNSPDLRNIEMEQHKKHVVSCWEGQTEERKMQEEKEKLEKERIEQQLEEERILAMKYEKEQEIKRVKEEQELKDILKRQMEELKNREVQANNLQSQEEMLQKQQWHLEKMNDERKKMEEQRKKMEFGKILLRQHAAALKRRSLQIQQELKEDQELLERLIEQQQQEKHIETARREKAQADAEWMRGVVKQQLLMEKNRETELSQLYQDEAARVWQQREAEWSRERAARERLMNEVIKERKSQVEARMQYVQEQQKESLERREELLLDMEKANQLAKMEQLKKQEERQQIKKEIDAQMSARMEKKLAEELKLKLDLDDEDEQQRGYEEFLQNEASELTARNFQQKGFGRKQAWT